MPEFKEFERRFKFKSRFKYGWFLLPALNLNRVLADLNRGSNSLNSISGVLIRTLLYIQRTNLSGSVKWNNYMYLDLLKFTQVWNKEQFPSLILFCIFMIKLISRLRVYCSGCQLGGVSMGIFVYADDNICVAPIRNGLQYMKNVCEQFANLLSMKFLICS